MDLGFHRRNRARLREDGALDYHAVVAGLAAAQARGVTAMAAERIAHATTAFPGRDAALVVLMLCEPGWVRAAAALGGSFDAALSLKFPPLKP
ncbi:MULTISPECIES: hypothetical protein [Sphingomonas]|uniref:Uncharacterized protein n=2 Tax=Sphingomonas TaxID=13687 RepID=A0A7W9BU87_9SPHN|nr:hypothetical protein [Sphingomonas prati]MBB5729758.1 hypothetical protein [Sphingomonas prati]GGE89748.1 hypothetical protein GCM10011404_23270 [Sphingomonas prati]